MILNRLILFTVLYAGGSWAVTLHAADPLAVEAELTEVDSVTQAFQELLLREPSEGEVRHYRTRIAPVDGVVAMRRDLAADRAEEVRRIEEAKEVIQNTMVRVLEGASNYTHTQPFDDNAVKHFLEIWRRESHQMQKVYAAIIGDNKSIVEANIMHMYLSNSENIQKNPIPYSKLEAFYQLVLGGQTLADLKAEITASSKSSPLALEDIRRENEVKWGQYLTSQNRAIFAHSNFEHKPFGGRQISVVGDVQASFTGQPKVPMVHPYHHGMEATYLVAHLPEAYMYSPAIPDGISLLLKGIDVAKENIEMYFSVQSTGETMCAEDAPSKEPLYRLHNWLIPNDNTNVWAYMGIFSPENSVVRQFGADDAFQMPLNQLSVLQVHAHDGVISPANARLQSEPLTDPQLVWSVGVNTQENKIVIVLHYLVSADLAFLGGETPLKSFLDKIVAGQMEGASFDVFLRELLAVEGEGAVHAAREYVVNLFSAELI